MIHTASLVHDDVLDDCDVRRGIVQSQTGINKPYIASTAIFGALWQSNTGSQQSDVSLCGLWVSGQLQGPGELLDQAMRWVWGRPVFGLSCRSIGLCFSFEETPAGGLWGVLHTWFGGTLSGF